VCTPSRSVLYTGQHIQHTGMFDNTNVPWINSMSTDLPTIGEDVGQMLPGGVDGGWVATGAVNDV
jgi:arylsulfatase